MNRYREVSDRVEVSHTDRRERYETLYYPKFKYSENDIYILPKRGDRLDLLAFDFYKDTRLWWVIQIANNLPGGTLMVEPGKRIRIPQLTVNDIETLITEAQF